MPQTARIYSTLDRTVPPLSSKCSHSFCTFTSPERYYTPRHPSPFVRYSHRPRCITPSNKQNTTRQVTSQPVRVPRHATTVLSYLHPRTATCTASFVPQSFTCPHVVDAARRRVVGLLLVTTNIYYGSVIYENRDSETSMEWVRSTLDWWMYGVLCVLCVLALVLCVC